MRSHLLRLGVMAAIACGVLIALERTALSFGGEKIDPIGEPKGFKAGEPARYAIWAKKGVWERVFNALIENPDFEYLIIDSTIVRAHQHAAGAKGGAKMRRSGVRAAA